MIVANSTPCTLAGGKASGLISSVGGVLDELRATGFHLSNALCEAVLRAAGEL